MEPLSRVKVQAALENLPACLSVVHDCAVLAGFGHKRILEVEIAAEEALVNVIRYAYDFPGGYVEVRCSKDTGRSLILEIRDEGPPFDPLALTPPDVMGGIAERRIGGLGVHIMRRLADTVEYVRDGSFNVLLLRFAETVPA
jgi:anti-sigma regulatory factor (Ser/Thr protein kinase)